MNRIDLINKYINFFEKKDHKKIKNASLIPENDPTVLFTTAGMHPLVPYLLGQKHPEGKKLTNVQKCIRTGDIEEVGDTYHHTFFEMLGNWSLGDYFKKEAIEMSFEFITKELEIPLSRFAVTIFAGNTSAKKDLEAKEIWKTLGISEDRIAVLEENWWEMPTQGPCGPDTEMFYWKPNNLPAPKKFDPTDSNWVEIWNNVLMEYEKKDNKTYLIAKQKNIDTGMGVERTVAILNNLEDNYLADMWNPIIKEIELLSNKKYKEYQKEMRIIADHIKAACFILNDGITPGPSEQGYVLRRLIRKAIRIGKKIELENFTTKISKPIFKIYPDYNLNEEKINQELKKEEEKFTKTLQSGLKKFNQLTNKTKSLNGKDAFLLYQSFGFPLELISEECKEKNVFFKKEEYQKELEKHQELSKTASIGKFKSGLLNTNEQTTKLHTATHLLLSALNKVLNKKIEQRGSNITQERLRFDFNFDRKLTPEEIKKIEDLVNEQIKNQLNIKKEEMSPKEAKEKGATGIFDEKYKEKVSVFTIGEFSKEICTGPHVNNTKELGNFKIIKEESSSSGIRRIKAILI